MSAPGSRCCAWAFFGCHESGLLLAVLKEGDILTFDGPLSDLTFFLQNEKGERFYFENQSGKSFVAIPENGLYTMMYYSHGGTSTDYVKVGVHRTEDASVIKDNYSNTIKNGVDKTFYRCEVRLPDGRVIWDTAYFENSLIGENNVAGRPSIVLRSEVGTKFQWYEIVSEAVDGITVGTAAKNDTNSAKYESEYWTPVLNSTDEIYYFFTFI